MQARSAMIVPLLAGGRLRGELVLIAGAGRRRYDMSDLVFAEDVGARAGQALENARLYDALASAEAHFRAAFEHAPTGVALARLGEQGQLRRLIDSNPALCAITGYAREELVGMDYDQLVHPDDRDAARQAAQWLLNQDVTHYNADRRYLHKSGQVIWVHVSAALYHHAGGVAEAVLQVQDVTERKRFEGQLQHLADHDALTGLYNRRRFLEELDWVAAYAQRYATEAAVLVVDVDNFTAVNDTHGDAVGDELLGAVAHALQERSRDTDILGRLGGDEFAIILPHASRSDAQAAADNMVHAVRTRATVLAGGRRVAVTGSVGVRLIGPDCELTAAELLSEADIALYDAKESGGDRASIVGQGNVEPERVRSRRAWSARIRTALAEDGFVLYEQPILALGNDRIERSELLIRMLSPDGDVIPPSVFLEVAQRFGQMRAIDRWVIDHAIRLLADRRAAGLELCVHVNLSGDSLTDEGLMDFIAAAVRNAPIDPTRLVFEVTETEAIVNVERARQLARRLSSLGCGLALDDFGSGFGSFYYLKHLPFDLIKIDGDFVRELPASRTDQLTIEAIVQIARGLGKPTVAEFVGDDATLALLRRLGVDFAQGYHLGVPGPVATVPHFALSG
jgi:diguanylate cyclase (GGDEF)-like protein/PAS domain S-box-containing protein